MSDFDANPAVGEGAPASPPVTDVPMKRDRARLRRPETTTPTAPTVTPSPVTPPAADATLARPPIVPPPVVSPPLSAAVPPPVSPVVAPPVSAVVPPPASGYPQSQQSSGLGRRFTSAPSPESPADFSGASDEKLPSDPLYVTPSAAMVEPDARDFDVHPLPFDHRTFNPNVFAQQPFTGVALGDSVVVPGEAKVGPVDPAPNQEPNTATSLFAALAPDHGEPGQTDRPRLNEQPEPAPTLSVDSAINPALPGIGLLTPTPMPEPAGLRGLEITAFVTAILLPPLGLILAVVARGRAKTQRGWVSDLVRYAIPLATVLTIVLLGAAAAWFFVQGRADASAEVALTTSSLFPVSGGV